MEENPIYGNLSYMQTSKRLLFFLFFFSLSTLFFGCAYRLMCYFFSTGLTLLTEADPPHSRNQARVNSDSQVGRKDPRVNTYSVSKFSCISTALLFRCCLMMPYNPFTALPLLPPPRLKLRTAMPTWHWSPPCRSLAAALRRSSTQT